MTERRIKTPLLARQDLDDNRFYEWTGEWPTWLPARPLTRFWGVTTLMSAGLIKEHLPAGYARRAALAAIEALEGHGRRTAPTLLRELAALGRADLIEAHDAGRLTSVKIEDQATRDLAYRRLAGAMERFRDSQADKGSEIHGIAEDLVLRVVGQLVAEGLDPTEHRLILPAQIPYLSELVRPYIDRSFRAWLTDFGPRFHLTEASVFSRYGYAGTLDAIVEIYVIPPGERKPRWVRVLVDYKSGGDIWRDVAVQLTAYSRTDFVGLPDGSAVPLPDHEAGYAAVLHLTPFEKRPYTFRWVLTGDDVFRVWLNVCEVARWILPSDGHPKGVAAEVIGDRINPVLDTTPAELPPSLW